MLIYNGADDTLVYRTGIVRFDRADPRRVLSRTMPRCSRPKRNGRKPARSPTLSSIEGLLRRGDRWLLYYGGADKYVGVAEAAAR